MGRPQEVTNSWKELIGAIVDIDYVVGNKAQKAVGYKVKGLDIDKETIFLSKPPKSGVKKVLIDSVKHVEIIEPAPEPAVSRRY
jgi:hypothetical protein